jgi:putative hemolysin
MLLSIEVSIILLLILLNGVLAMSELALVSAKKAKLKQLSSSGNRGADAALALTETNKDFLASIQVGITLIGVLAGAFSGATLAEELSKEIVKLYPALTRYADAVALSLVVIVITYLSLVVGELVPKRLALYYPEAIAVRVAKTIGTLGKALHPVVYLLTVSTNFVLRLFGLHRHTKDTVSAEEIRILIDEGASVGVFDEREQEMMRQVMRLEQYKIEDLMTPRSKVIAIDVNDPLAESLAVIARHTHTYYPIYDGELDRPLGVLSIKSLLPKLIEKRPINLRSEIISCVFLPEKLPADYALEKLQETGKHMALVVDEYGGFSGILTIYDITESIVGEIPGYDEHRSQAIVERADKSILIEGQLPFVDLVDHLRLDASIIEEQEGFQTVGGFIMHRLGKIPKEGDCFEDYGYRFEVVDMDRNRVDKVLATPLSND